MMPHFENSISLVTPKIAPQIITLSRLIFCKPIGTVWIFLKALYFALSSPDANQCVVSGELTMFKNTLNPLFQDRQLTE